MELANKKKESSNAQGGGKPVLSTAKAEPKPAPSASSAQKGLSTSTNKQSLVQSGAGLMSQLAAKQKAELAQMTKVFAEEENMRMKELKDSINYEKEVGLAEEQRKQDEIVQKQEAEDLKLLQEEEAAKKQEAEIREQEFLMAQAVQEKKAATAKHAATRANLARLKRKDAIMKRNAEAKLKILKLQQETELEKLMINEKQQLA